MAKLTPEQFDTDRIIILNFIVGAGGKFLANSIALSRQAVLSHQQLTTFTSEQKLDWLCNGYDSMSSTIWQDLDLGCIQLFGNTHNLISYKDKISESTKWQYNNIIPKLIKQQKYFFVVAHNSNRLVWLTQIWPNAKIIRFVNYVDFMKKYRPYDLSIVSQGGPSLSLKKHIADWWQDHRNESWPALPPLTLDDYQLPEYQKIAADIEPINQFIVNLTIQPQYDLTGTVLDHWSTDWDAACYLDQELYLQQLEILYNKIGLVDFDANNVKQLYARWTKALERYRSNNRSLKGVIP
jgi:hypothetical protein